MILILLIINFCKHLIPRTKHINDRSDFIIKALSYCGHRRTVHYIHQSWILIIMNSDRKVAVSIYYGSSYYIFLTLHLSHNYEFISFCCFFFLYTLYCLPRIYFVFLFFNLFLRHISFSPFKTITFNIFLIEIWIYLKWLNCNMIYCRIFL